MGTPLLVSLVTLLYVTNDQVTTMTGNDVIYCRDSWVERMSYEDFAVYACSKCFVQVFWAKKDLTIVFPPTYPYLLIESGAIHPDQPTSSLPDNVTVYHPDAESKQSVVCAKKLTSDECRKWRGCCQAAKRCCLLTQQQQATRDNGSCPSTWDGISCWEETPAGQTAIHSCPNYYELDTVRWTSPKVYRQCDADSSWHINPNTSQEYSEYAECFNMTKNIRILKISLYIDFAGNGLSVLSLIAAIMTIICIRSLRGDLHQRMALRIHFNLFVAVLCSSCFTVAFHSIYHDAFTSSHPVYRRNSVWCRALHIITKYFKSTTYMAMFCEGLFLYRRISQVMQIRVTESLVKYLLVTWIVPVITFGVYVTARLATGQNNRCWIDDKGLSLLEYIHMIPNLSSLVCNLIFLICIEYMLCTKMRSDTSDRRVEVFRHAIRATMSLIPVFGIQFLFLIYRPKYWPPYEIIVAIFESTQGTMVAVLYCFTTKEVKSELRPKFQRNANNQQTFLLRRMGRLGTGASASIKVTVTRPLCSEERSRKTFGHQVRRFLSRYQRHSQRDGNLQNGYGGKSICLEVIQSARRDSCESRLTQRSRTDSAESSSVLSQYKLDLRRNGTSKTSGQDPGSDQGLLDGGIGKTENDVASSAPRIESDTPENGGPERSNTRTLSPIDEFESHRDSELWQ